MYQQSDSEIPYRALFILGLIFMVVGLSESSGMLALGIVFFIVGLTNFRAAHSDSHS